MKNKKIILDEPTQKFLHELKNMRQVLGLSQVEAARKIGIPLKTYRYYEYGESLPSLLRLVRLLEFFNYEIPESINHKKYYGGLKRIWQEEKAICQKRICLDERAQKFLSELRSERKKLGLTLNEAAVRIGCDFTTLGDYERGRSAPLLGKFIKLAELYQYDISDSLNYKFFYGKIDGGMVRHKLRRYGLGMKELSKLTNYSENMITWSMYFRSECSLECLAAILKVIKQEEEQFTYRQELLKKIRANDTYLTQAHYPHRRRNYA